MEIDLQNKVMLNDGSEIPIMAYVKYNPYHIEFYTADGDHYIFRAYPTKIRGNLKIMKHEFFKRIMVCEEDRPEPYSIEYIVDDNICAILIFDDESEVTIHGNV